jgi:hypothetical protein
VDSNTVRLLQMRFPKYSLQDRMLIEQFMHSRQLFPEIAHEPTRTQIWSKLLSINCMIPSIETFFENTIWFEACAKVLRGILPKKYKGTMRDVIMRRYKGTGQSEGKAKIQTSEGVQNRFMETPASELECIKLGYYQL